MTAEDFDNAIFDDEATHFAQAVTRVRVKIGLFFDRLRPFAAGVAAIALVALLPWFWTRAMKSRQAAPPRQPAVDGAVASKIAHDLANGMKVQDMKNELNQDDMSYATTYEPPSYSSVPPPAYVPRYQPSYSSPPNNFNPWTGGTRISAPRPNTSRYRPAMVADPWSAVLEEYGDELVRRSQRVPSGQDPQDDRNIGVRHGS